MFLLLSKAAEPMLAPLTWTLLLALAALLLRRRRRTAWGLALAAIAVLVAASSDPVANALQHAVERDARSSYRPEVVYDAVVVLSGMVDLPASRESGETELTAAADRLARGFELFRAGRARNILVSGTSAFPEPGDVPEADRLAALLARWGVPPDHLFAEARSRNTRENAIETARFAAAHGWRSLLVVTSAAHLPRALGCFRAVGLEPDALPVDRRAAGYRLALVPRAAALVKSTRAIHELAGRWAYRLAGYAR